MNAWESIFSQSKANHGFYDEEALPNSRWEWPRHTWFQARLDYIREHELSHFIKPGKKPAAEAQSRVRQ
jgi:hypothetical protein